MLWGHSALRFAIRNMVKFRGDVRWSFIMTCVRRICTARDMALINGHTISILILTFIKIINSNSINVRPFARIVHSLPQLNMQLIEKGSST